MSRCTYGGIDEGLSTCRRQPNRIEETGNMKEEGTNGDEEVSLHEKEGYLGCFLASMSEAGRGNA